MADNLTPPGFTGKVATDEVVIAGETVHIQRVKLDLGAENSSDPAVETVPVRGTVDLGPTTLAALETITLGGAIDLSPASLAALESVTVGGSVELGAASLAALESISVGGTVDLSPASLAALETITVGGTVDLSPTSLAALESITVGGTVDLSPAALAALESITVGGTVELGATSLAALEVVTAAGVATETTLAALNDKVPAPVGGRLPVALPPGGGGLTDTELRASPVPVSQSPPPFVRVGFAEVGSGLQGLAATELTLVQTGAGQAVSQAGGNLVITTGTTVNSETIIRSVRTFSGSLLARVKVILSQRIANQTFRFELADLVGEALAYTINSATSVTVTFPTGTNPFTAANVGQSIRLSALSSVGIPGRYAIASTSGDSVTFTVAGWPASGGGTLSLYGWNSIWSEYSGTSATSVNFDAARRGWASGATGVSINTTASPGHVAQLGFDVFTAGYSDALVASNAGYQWTGRASRIENIPDPDVPLYLFIVVQNGSTAPASTTTLTVGFIQVEDQGRQKVRIAGSDPVASHALPVQLLGGTTGVTGTVGVTGYPAAAASADALANPTVTKIDATGLLFNGTTWDRARNNINVAVEASSAKTASGNGAAQTNFNARGLFVWINVTAVSGTTPTLTVRLQWSPDGGTTWLDLDTTNAQTVSITATGQHVLRVYPGMATAANASLNSILPRTWRLAWTIGGTTPSFTFAAQAAYVN